MFDWLWGKRTPEEPTQSCAGCGDALPPGRLVPINHCYHTEVGYGHRGCVGFRLLCVDCHQHLGCTDYYVQALEQRAMAAPEQYPWDRCMLGLRLYLPELDRLVALGVDPTNENDMGIAWQRQRLDVSPQLSR